MVSWSATIAFHPRRGTMAPLLSKQRSQCQPSPAAGCVSIGRGGRESVKRRGGAMKSPNEFWLHLHELSSAYEAEGKSPQERHEAIVNQLRRMPSIARSEVLESFWLVAQNLPALYWA